MNETRRIQVLMPQEEADRFEAYCRDMGFKKSPLIARLVREHMDEVGYRTQRGLFDNDDKGR